MLRKNKQNTHPIYSLLFIYVHLSPTFCVFNDRFNLLVLFVLIF